MIKLLRKLRQSMINGGKIKNYLLYAIGEILLVVIGILIALQINNWNEEYKDNQLEKTYYCKLLEDVNQDQLLIEKLIRENNQRIKYCNQLLYALQQVHPERKNVIFLLRETISKIRFRFRPSVSAFDDLKSNGKLAIIKDLALKKQLLNYYAEMEGYGDISDLVANASLNLYYNQDKDFVELGFQDIYYVKKELDTTLVNTNELKAKNFPSPQVRKQLLSEGMFNLTNNARKKELYATMMEETQKIKKVLNSKCEQR
ncbi:MAG TPA: hypothetical protein DGG95_16820 [Cytophagales bacterium]|jgi:hypothetical protein|nr:hypothetical protein [Cytophagales bacterium]